MTRMSLSQLIKVLPEARQLAPGDPPIERIVSDSRQVRPGDLFVAIAGNVVDGHKFIADAARAGAAAVAVERAESAPPNLPTILVADGRKAAARLAHFLAGDPTGRLTVCGVTGTNGKTTTSYMMRSIFEQAGRRTGLLGTISYELGSRSIAAPNTTPGPVELASYFAEMVREGLDAAVMEVSSHALDQGRTQGVRFQAAAFTNLTPDHLDYHKDMTSYRNAKGVFFADLDPAAAAVLNLDDEASRYYASITPARQIWFSLLRQADIWADGVEVAITGTTFNMHLGGHRYPLQLRMIGRHNVYNAMTAAGLAQGLGMNPSEIIAGLERLAAVPGRLEPVEAGQPFAVLVDYAHTEDALVNSLGSVRPLTKGRLIVVFGCGGDRDRTKRPRMAAVTERLADVVIVTSDNPRSESPEAIAAEIFKGFKTPARPVLELNRAAAIHRAIDMAVPGDVVLIAGKGHENYQITGQARRHFDDREESRLALAASGYGAAAGGPGQ